MTKIFCDKCEKELGFMEARTIRMESADYYLYLKGQNGRENSRVAMGELTLCVVCKDKFGEKIKNFLNEP